jgi:hypothetical protein
VDADGLDRGGIRLPEIAVPLATITGWNLRAPERGAPEEMVEFLGSIWPFAKAEIARRYPAREDYMKRVGAAADDLVKQRYLLPRDREWAVDRAAKLWEAIVQ